LRNELTEGRRRPGLHTLGGAAIRLRPLLVLAGLIALVGQIVLLLPFAFEHTELAIDAVQLQAAGERIRADAPIYWHWADYGPDIDAPGGRPRPLETTAYPPLLLPIFALLPDVPFATFARVWAVLLVGGLWLYAASIARIVAGRTTIGGVLIAGFFLALIPGGGTNVKQGNIDPLLWAGYGWALFTQTLLTDLDPARTKVVSVDALPAELAYVDKGIAPVLLAQPVYMWGYVGVQTIVDHVINKKDVPVIIPMELVRVSKETLSGYFLLFHNSTLVRPSTILYRAIPQK
jgi:hypothetical protein